MVDLDDFLPDKEDAEDAVDTVTSEVGGRVQGTQQFLGGAASGTQSAVGRGYSGAADFATDVTGAEEWAENNAAEYQEQLDNQGALGSFDTRVRAGFDFLLDNPNASVQDASRAGIEALTGVESDQQGEVAQEVGSDVRGALDSATDDTALDNAATDATVWAGEALIVDPARAGLTATTGIDPQEGDTEGTVGAVDVFDIGVTIGTAGVGGAAASSVKAADDVPGLASRVASRFGGGSDDAAGAVDDVAQFGDEPLVPRNGFFGFRRRGAGLADDSGGVLDNLTSRFARGGDDAASGVDDVSTAGDDVTTVPDDEVTRLGRDPEDSVDAFNFSTRSSSAGDDAPAILDDGSRAADEASASARTVDDASQTAPSTTASQSDLAVRSGTENSRLLSSIRGADDAAGAADDAARFGDDAAQASDDGATLVDDGVAAGDDTTKAVDDATQGADDFSRPDVEDLAPRAADDVDDSGGLVDDLRDRLPSPSTPSRPGLGGIGSLGKKSLGYGGLFLAGGVAGSQAWDALGPAPAGDFTARDPNGIEYQFEFIEKLEPTEEYPNPGRLFRVSQGADVEGYWVTVGTESATEEGEEGTVYLVDESGDIREAQITERTFDSNQRTA